MNDMLPGLNGGKMSASMPDSKIDCLDSPEVVKRKIAAVECHEGVSQGNGLLALIKLVLVPISQLRIERARGLVGYSLMEGAGELSAQRPFTSDDAPTDAVFTIDKGSFKKHYLSYEEVERDYASMGISPQALKDAVAGAVNQLLARVRALYERSPEWQEVEKLAYPCAEEE